jgi:lysophospholipase L1-like esterase
MTAGTTSTPVEPLHSLDAGIPESYVFKLQSLLQQRYTAQTIEVYNAGQAGQRAAEDRGRLEDALRESQPEVLLLLEGANDLNKVGNRDAISPTIGALEELIGEGTSRGVKVFVGTLPPQRTGAKSHFAEFVEDFNADVRKMAPEEGATLVDLFAGMSIADVGEDGLHPTEAGYQRMAEIWFEALKNAFEAPAEAARRPR